MILKISPKPQSLEEDGQSLDVFCPVVWCDPKALLLVSGVSRNPPSSFSTARAISSTSFESPVGKPCLVFFFYMLIVVLKVVKKKAG